MADKKDIVEIATKGELARASNKKEPNLDQIWHNTGGGSFVGPSDDELVSDTSYEADDGRTIEFITVPDLRYDFSFFPEHMTEKEMLEKIEEVKSIPKQARTYGICDPQSIWYFDRELEKKGYYELIMASLEVTGPAIRNGQVLNQQTQVMYQPVFPVLYEVYISFGDYLQSTDGEGHEEQDRNKLLFAIEVIIKSNNFEAKYAIHKEEQLKNR